jgi:hypothetical protein
MLLMSRILICTALLASSGCAKQFHGGEDEDDLSSARDSQGEHTPRCGDGSKQGGEQCDDGSETWECDASCKRTRFYNACSASTDCENGQQCLDGACTEQCTQQANGWFSCPSADIPAGAVGVVCYLEGLDSGYCRPRCSADSDCPRGLHCAPDHVCQADETHDNLSED